jgi:signal recognition particle receptor subunit alpha
MAALDEISISTSSGLVLWTKSYGSVANSKDQGAAISSLVQQVLLNDSNSSSQQAASAGECSRYDKDSQSLMWTLANDLGLIFVVVWPRILHLSFLEKLLQTMKTLFINMFGDTVRTITNAEAAGRQHILDWASLWKGWDAIVTKLVRELELEASKNQRRGGGQKLGGASAGVSESDAAASAESDGATTPTLSPSDGKVVDAEAIARNIAALKARNKARLSPSPRGAKVGKKGGASSASEASECVRFYSSH